MERSTRTTSNTLVELHCIDNGKKIWWDLRPHPTFGTLEFRICDVPTIAARDDRAGRAGAGDRREAVSAARAATSASASTTRALIEENKWRAARCGHRRQADRLRQARSEVPMRELALRAARVRRRRGGRAGQPARRSEYVHADPRATAPAPIGSCRSTGRPATCARSSGGSSTETRAAASAAAQQRIDV